MCGAVYYSPQRVRMAELSEEAMRIAERLDDPEAQACARAARRRALWDPAHLKERLSASTEMLTYAGSAGSLELQLHAHAWLVLDLLERGDRSAVDAQIDAFSAKAEQLRQPLYLWQAAVWRAMQALLEGKLELTEELAAEALAAGAPAEGVTAAQYYAIQLIAVRREQARIGELEPTARQMVASNPARAAWRAALATTLSESGQLDAARAELDQLAAQNFRDIPEDGDWITTVTLLCDLCATLGDARRAGLLYEALEPYAGVNAVAGIAVLCFGSAARFLGKLAATIGREREAAAHFEQALEENERLKSPVLLAHTQLDFATALRRRVRASELVDEAAATAESLGLPWVALRARRLREG
jgi:tetratricopeptide (TPR) repeat protein